MKLIDRVGQRYGRLIVVSRWGRTSGGKTSWMCICECGEYVSVSASDLKTGNTSSCGCLSRMHPNNCQHGQEGTRLYRIWEHIKSRCNNPNVPCYKRYGGRGIRVCKEWHAFIPFYMWAIKNGYNKDLNIDRRNNNAGYCPSNCRFVTIKINNQNKRNSREWHVHGDIFNSAADAADYFNVNPQTIRNWCLGNKRQNHKPKQGCFANRLYLSG